uniref:Transcriptional adapter 1 n=1 Tax=Ciona intestinalis TaxID=7719 RepID=F6QES8_CIOIN|nr:transcriptional adapter 1-like [Ciona intestinalis]|eukprot:XP_002129042.1 transcriptional adapter 1-like [Ciona intestinalis]
MSSQARDNLILAKKRLVQVLGDNEKAYWSNMKAWFKHGLTKEEFDVESRRLLPKDGAHLHNMFLLAVLTKCHVSSSSSSKDTTSTVAANKIKKNRRIQSLKRKFDHRFTPHTPVPSPTPPGPHKPAPKPTQQPIRTCIRTYEVPSIEEMVGYTSVIAWEAGLDEATDGAVEFATEAVRVFLKNILSAIFTRRSAYKLFRKARYSMGCEPTNPYLHNRSSPNDKSLLSYEEKEQQRIEEIGKTSQIAVDPKGPVNLYDLLYTLKTYRLSLIPSNTVYSSAVERVVSHMWHPSHDEVECQQKFTTLMKS